MNAETSAVPAIDLGGGAAGSDIWGGALVAVVVLVALVYLVRKFRPSRKGGCPSCGESARCGSDRILTSSPALPGGGDADRKADMRDSGTGVSWPGP